MLDHNLYDTMMDRPRSLVAEDLTVASWTGFLATSVLVVRFFCVWTLSGWQELGGEHFFVIPMVSPLEATLIMVFEESRIKTTFI